MAAKRRATKIKTGSLERLEGVAVFSEILILWKQLGGGARESTKAVKAKDEDVNPPLFEWMGVEDLVLVYPWRPQQRRPGKET
jgi:hypothetical protein